MTSSDKDSRREDHRRQWKEMLERQAAANAVDDGLEDWEREAQRNPKQALANITTQLDERKRDFFWGIEDSLLESIDDTSIVDRAKESANEGFDRAQERNARHLSRLGITQSNSNAAENSRLSRLTRGANYVDTVNNARLKQFDRNESLKTQLLNNSRALTGQAIDGMTSATSLQTARENDHNSRKAAAKAQQASTLATLGTAAILLA